MICVECGREYKAGMVIHGLAICPDCMAKVNPDEQLPRLKVVEPNFRRIARKRHYTRDWR